MYLTGITKHRVGIRVRLFVTHSSVLKNIFKNSIYNKSHIPIGYSLQIKMALNCNSRTNSKSNSNSTSSPSRRYIPPVFNYTSYVKEIHDVSMPSVCMKHIIITNIYSTRCISNLNIPFSTITTTTCKSFANYVTKNSSNTYNSNHCNNDKNADGNNCTLNINNVN